MGLFWAPWHAVKKGILYQEPGQGASPPFCPAFPRLPSKEPAADVFMVPPSQALILPRHHASHSISNGLRKENSRVHRLFSKIFLPSDSVKFSLHHIHLFSFDQGPLFFSHKASWHLHTDHAESRVRNPAPCDYVEVQGREPLFGTLLLPPVAPPTLGLKTNKTFLNFPIPLPLRSGCKRWNSIPCLLSPFGSVSMVTQIPGSGPGPSTTHPSKSPWQRGDIPAPCGAPPGSCAPCACSRWFCSTPVLGEAQSNHFLHCSFPHWSWGITFLY